MKLYKAIIMIILVCFANGSYSGGLFGNDGFFQKQIIDPFRGKDRSPSPPPGSVVINPGNQYVPSVSEPPNNLPNTQPITQMPQYSSRCQTNIGSCILNSVGPVGSSCWCNAGYNQINGVLLP